MQSLCWYKLNSPQGSAMDGRAPCGFLLRFGGGGGIIGIWEMWEREREHHGERVEIWRFSIPERTDLWMS